MCVCDRVSPAAIAYLRALHTLACSCLISAQCCHTELQVLQHFVYGLALPYKWVITIVVPLV